MIINVDVTVRFHVEVEEAVLREERQHVIEKWDTRIDLGRAPTVERQRERNIGFSRFACDGACASTPYELCAGWNHHPDGARPFEARRYSGVFSHASKVSLRTRISASVPTLMRRNGAVKAWLGKCRTRTFRE